MKTAYLVALFCLASVTTFAVQRDSDNTVTIVQLKFAAFNRHDVIAIEALYATGAVLHSPDYPNLVGNGPIAATYRRLFESITDAKDELQSLGSDAHEVYAQFVLTGHLKGNPDALVRVRIMSIYTVEAGHIVEDATYYDRKT